MKLLNKLASAKASGRPGGSKVITDLIKGLEEPVVAVELRLKIDQNHPDLKGRYETFRRCLIQLKCIKYDMLIFCFQILPRIWRGCATTPGKFGRGRSKPM